MTPADDDEGTPVSVQIRERIRASRQRFHSNDNIAEFIQPGELDKLVGADGIGSGYVLSCDLERHFDLLDALFKSGLVEGRWIARLSQQNPHRLHSRSAGTEQNGKK